MKVVFQDPTFSLQLLRTIGETYYKTADIGDVYPLHIALKKEILRVGISSG
jgi:hypothetical protein